MSTARLRVVPQPTIREIPVILDPVDGLLWNGNNRTFGGKTHALLGDSGYDNGARAAQIRDGLRALIATEKKATPADLHAVQLDDRALFLERWQKLLLDTLTEVPGGANTVDAVLASQSGEVYMMLGEAAGRLGER